ncbi:MAG TPA: mercuric reductase [Acidimicrobiales bacterium]|nr:mercuric reductase [Acidimicrobiales bacterium]
MVEHFDALVLGGGMAGLPLALRAARHESVVLIERELLGGTCLNRGCIPTKTMIASAEVAHSARQASTFGVSTSDPEVDLARVVARKNGIVEMIRAGSYRAVEGRRDLEFIHGDGRFVDDHTIEVAGRRIHADRIFLNTGSRDSKGGISGLDDVSHLNSRTILELEELPRHLVVVGGGFIGCEFAQMFRRFGTEVTIVQRADRLLPGEDPEISAAVEEGFADDGITVLTSTSCTEVAGAPGAITVGCTGGADTVTGSHLLVAVGRVPNSDGIGLDHLGVETDPSGFVAVDERLQAAGATDVWALGDLRGGPMFTHTARDDADIIYRNVYRDGDRSTAGRIVAHAVFVDPEVGSVGLTEDAARAAGHDVIVGRQPFAGVARAIALGRTRGLVKFVVDATDDTILGCHIAGPHASDLIHEVTLAMYTGAGYGDVGAMIHVHPTLSEAVNSAAGGVHRPAAPPS